jgi:hypothetical protein
MFMESFVLWTHKDQVSPTPLYYCIYEYLICPTMYITWHMVGLLFKKKHVT